MWIIGKVIAMLVNSIFALLCMIKITKVGFKFSLKNICVIWVTSLLIVLLSFLPSDILILKPFFSLIISIFMYNKIYSNGVFNSVPISFVVIVIFFIGEIIYSLLLLLFSIDFQLMINSWQGNIISNFVIGLMCYLSIKNKLFINILRKTLTKLKKNQHKILFSSMIFLMGIFAYRNAYYTLNFNYIINLLLIIIFLIFLVTFFNEKKNREKLSLEQEVLYNWIIKYEKELTEKNKLIHDFKNQLFAIRGFVFGDNNKLEEYLSTLISDLKTLDDFKIKEINKIPLGGLKGLFYCKLMDLDNTNIKLNVYIDKKISCIERLNIRIYKNIVKILGIYIDNAIEAAKESKEKELEIEFYKQGNKLIFTITNSYVGKIFKEKLGTIGYSNKGKGRGYGLSYAKDILDKEENLKEIRKITDNKYSVELVINI